MSGSSGTFFNEKDKSRFRMLSTQEDKLQLCFIPPPSTAMLSLPSGVSSLSITNFVLSLLCKRVFHEYTAISAPARRVLPKRSGVATLPLS